MSNDQAVLLAMEAAYERAFSHARGTQGFGLVAETGLTRVESTVPSPWFNSVLSTRLPISEQDTAIARVSRLYSDRGMPLLWRAGPASTNRESLCTKLAAAGFHPAPPSTAILGPIPALIELWEVLPLPVRGVRVSGPAEYAQWFALFADAFGVAPSLEPFFSSVAARTGFEPEAETQNLLIERGGMPVACATTLWRPGEAFASVFNVAVAPSMRRKGLGKYILGYAALRLRRQGCRAIGQFSTQAGMPFYLGVTPSRRLGEFENWIQVPA